MIEKKIQNSFCPVPWTELYTTTLGTFGMCCVEDQSYNKNKILINDDFQKHFDSEYMKNTRKDMLNGQRPAQCKACWNTEDRGAKSLRQARLERYEQMIDFNSILDCTKIDGSSSIMPIAARLSVGKICQLRCVSCSPSHSTGVKKDYAQFNWDYEYKDRKFINTFNTTLSQQEMDKHLYPLFETFAPTLKWLDITGGEPTLSKKLKNFLEWLCLKGYSKDMTIAITTNGMSSDNSFFSVIKKFKYSILHLSIDGEGDLDEYLRYPTNYKKKIENISFYKNFFNKVTMLSTIWSMNVNNLDRLTHISHYNDLELNINLLEFPDELHMRHLPLNLKNIIESKLKLIILNNKNAHIREKISDVLKALGKKGNVLQWKKCLKIIKTYDKVRKKKLSDIDNIFVNLY